MKVYDVLTGRETALPLKDVAPGRYRVLADCKLNGHVPLSAGDLLWRCGSGLTRITDSRRPDLHVDVEFARDVALEQPDELLERAFDAVVQSSRAVGFDELPSPMLPPELQQIAELLPFEEELGSALDRSNLHEIAARPRLDMHYVPETLPVARAKRVSAEAVEHLAQHSENWSRRIIGGIVPARVLTRVSEDDYAIYENVVFVRLLDACWRWLSNRVQMLKALEAGYQGAQSLSNAEELNRLLRERLCTLWGSAWSTESQESRKTSEVRERLEKMLTEVTRLKRSKVYSTVPRSAHVPVHLRMTNILQFDKRYSTLRPLWDGVHRLSSRAGVNELSNYRRQEARFEQFQTYVWLVIRRALREMGACSLPESDIDTVVLGPWRVCLRQPCLGELQLTIRGAGPDVEHVSFGLLWSMDATQRRERIGSGDRHLLCAALPENNEVGASGEQLVVNPFRFYGVEWIRSKIEQKLMSLLLKAYPFSIDRIPDGLIQKLEAVAPEAVRRSNRGVVLLPTGSAKVEQISLALRDSKGQPPAASEHLKFALEANRWLARCRACGTLSGGSDVDADARGFRLRCSTCRLTTIIRTEPARNATALFGNEDANFLRDGAVAFSV
jgi:hypothetical protein